MEKDIQHILSLALDVMPNTIGMIALIEELKFRLECNQPIVLSEFNQLYSEYKNR